MTVDTQTYSPNYIDVSVQAQKSSLWRLTGMYGHPDFNEILSSDEKNGRNMRPMAPMVEFRHTLLHCGLIDMGFNGYRIQCLFETKQVELTTLVELGYG